MITCATRRVATREHERDTYPLGDDVDRSRHYPLDRAVVLINELERGGALRR
jgi:hypothetical protein